jgi:hypothetical protein
MGRLGWRTARNAEPVDPAISHLCDSILECELPAIERSGGSDCKQWFPLTGSSICSRRCHH